MPRHPLVGFAARPDRKVPLALRRRRELKDPRFSAVSAASAVRCLKSLISQVLHRRRKMRRCAAAAPFSAAFAPRNHFLTAARRA
jgi:hypothetical protein